LLRGRTEGKDAKPIIREPTANRAIVLSVAERAAFIGYGTSATATASHRFRTRCPS
jgi:hypothetical protein